MKDPAPAEAQYAFVDALKYFGKGVSWGGYESLLLPTGGGYRDRPDIRESMGYDDEMYRVSVGLESFEDLVADLENGFAARAAAIKSLSVMADI
jgi:cystathionine beta-lyase